jgi:hypothetical protein
VSDDKIIIVVGERFADSSPRQRAIDAQRTVEKVFGKKQPGFLTRAWCWLTGA